MKWVKNRPSLSIIENDLQTILYYTEVGDRAIIQLSQRCINGRIVKVLPTGLKVRIWDGEIGTIQFFRWYNIIEVKKLQVKHKVDFTEVKNRFIIIGLILLLVIGSIILYTNI